jgi:hypothetical protein
MRSCGAVATALRCHLPSSLLSCTVYHTSRIQPHDIKRVLSTFLGSPLSYASPCTSALRLDKCSLCCGDGDPQTSSSCLEANGTDTRAAFRGKCACNSQDDVASADGGALQLGEEWSRAFGVCAGHERGDAYRVVRRLEAHVRALELYIEVPELPRGCDVEVQPVCCVASGCAKDASVSTSDDEGGCQDHCATRALDFASAILFIVLTGMVRTKA